MQSGFNACESTGKAKVRTSVYDQSCQGISCLTVIVHTASKKQKVSALPLCLKDVGKSGAASVLNVSK